MSLFEPLSPCVEGVNPVSNKSKTKLSLLTPAPLFCPKSNEVRNIRMEPWLGAFRRSKTLPRRELSRLFLQKLKQVRLEDKKTKQ